MTFEIAISTMHKTKEQCLEMLKQENIHCNCIVINQCDIDGYDEVFVDNQHIRIFYTKERGLSKSRNMAVHNMSADIMAIGDDDLFYYDNFDTTILSYYKSNLNADIVLFNFDDLYKVYPNKSRRCCFFELTGYKSMQVTLTQKMRNIKFNEYFGTGSDYAQSGEENIFLADCWRNGANIYYCGNKILKRTPAESTWFKGYTDSFFMDKGAIYYAFSPFWYFLYALRFAIKMKSKVSLNYRKILSLMSKGKKLYIKTISNEKV